MTDSLSMAEDALKELVGPVVHESEAPPLLQTIQWLRSPIIPETINAHLENLAGTRVILGFFYQRAKKMAAEEKNRLESIYARLYNGERNANSSRGPKPTAESLKHSILSRTDYLECQASLLRLEYYRDLLKEIRDAFAERKSQLEQISNNIRFEGRLDQE